MFYDIFSYPGMALHSIHIPESLLGQISFITYPIQLSHITISNCKKYMLEIPDILNGIQSLEIIDSCQLTVLNIPSNFISLTKLSIIECPNMGSPTVPIDVRSLIISNGFLPTNTSNLKFIKRLSFTHNSYIQTTNLIGSCTSLHTLDLSYNSNLYNIDGLQFCASLRTLSLAHCVKLSNINSLASCLALRTIRLAYCIKLTNTVLP